MATSNAFIGRTRRPTLPEVIAALGPSVDCWNQFLSWLAEHDVRVQEWKSDAIRYGWSLRVKKQDRNIVYLAPCQGCFRVSLVLGSKAMEVVRHTPFPPAIQQAISEAPHYAEGTGIRIIVHKAADLAPLRTLTEIKLAS